MTGQGSMQVRIGTSGYQYKQWRGSFYGEKCKDADMLAAYATQLDSVEINNTFYRMPKREVLARWAQQVPESFRFAIKAPQRITHVQRLKAEDDSLELLLENLQVLGDKLGVVLFQLPPFLRKDEERLGKFLERLPKGLPVSFEFRHESWNDAAVHAQLREHGAALCTADVDEGDCELVATARFGYLRLRRELYSDAELAAWAARIEAQAWERAFVYFKHEDDATVLARRLRACFEGSARALASEGPDARPDVRPSVAKARPKPAKVRKQAG